MDAVCGMTVPACKLPAQAISSGRNGSFMGKALAERKLQPSARSRAASVRQGGLRVEAAEKARIGILGPAGYTGAECARLIAGHPKMELAALIGKEGRVGPYSNVYPHLLPAKFPNVATIDSVDFTKLDGVFACLPHAATQEMVKNLPASLKVVDLSADFRLKDVAVYAEWYGQPHLAVELQKTAVYGLTELHRDEIKPARLIANPGCYPTCSQLGLHPLIKGKLISTEDIIIDAKSGISGAGRGAKEAFLYCEQDGGMNAYGVGAHRHVPEIEQELSAAAGAPVKISFTPHIIPMSRGMQCTMYVKTSAGVSVDDLRNALVEAYKNEEFVKVLPAGGVPATRHVRGSNYCFLSVFKDRLAGRAIIISVIDNLVKGASGQAMQNMNLLLGFEETLGLMQQPMFP